MVEVNKLPAIVLTLVLVGLMVGIGVLIFDKFSAAAPDTKSVTNTSFTVPTNATNFTIGAKVKDNTILIQDADGHTQAATFYTLYEPDNNPNWQTHFLQAQDTQSVCNATATCYLTYDYYDFNTNTNTSMGANTTAVGSVGTDWMALIVTIVVLALILAMVIGSFQSRR